MKASVFTQKLKLPSYSYKKLKKDKNCNLTASCKEKNSLFLWFTEVIWVSFLGLSMSYENVCDCVQYVHIRV